MPNYTRTRSGVTPRQEREAYDIPTSAAQKYLQDRLNALIAKVKQSGDEDAKTMPSNIQITLRSLDIRGPKNFTPFICVLPLSVLKSEANTEQDRELSIFNPEKSNKRLNIYRPIMTFFKSYMYDDFDVRSMVKSRGTRDQYGISMTQAYTFKEYHYPRLTRLRRDSGGKGNKDAGDRYDEVITFYLDPIRVLHDMVEDENKRTDFTIVVNEVKKLRNGEFRYSFSKQMNKRNREKFNLESELNRIYRR